MSGFSAQWLTLREPYDLNARNPTVLDTVVAALESLHPVRIVDLACGTGSTMRALSQFMPAQQSWRLIDNDLGLLARAAAAPRAKQVSATTIPLDLNRDLEAALDGPIDMVATSALLDLVSEPWLDRLVIEIVARSIPFYAALTYDGRTKFSPSDPLDAAIANSVNLHQRTDKGFGPALGPAATSFAIARFESLGYSVVQGSSDWEMGPDDFDIQNELLNGWAGAAREVGAVSLSDTKAWLTRRLSALTAGHSSISVGHVDFFAIPIGTR